MIKKYSLLIAFLSFVMFMALHDPWSKLTLPVIAGVNSWHLHLEPFSMLRWPAMSVGLNLIGSHYFPPDPLSAVLFNRKFVVIEYLYLLGTANIGCTVLTYLLFYRIKNTFPVSFPLRFIAGFTFGYFVIIPLNRVVTFFYPQVVDYLIMFAIVAGCNIVILLYGIRSLIKNRVVIFNEKFLFSVIGQFFILGLVHFFILVFQLQYEMYHLTGDSTVWSLDVIKNMQVLSHFPIIGNQYDEVIYNYPLLSFLKIMKPAYVLATPYWFFQAMGKTSGLIVLYLMMYFFTRKKFLSWTTSIFFFIGSFVTVPTDVTDLFGAANPLLLIGHFQYLTMNIMNFVLLWILWSEQNQQHMGKVDRLVQSILLLIIGFGLASTGVNTVMNFLIVVAVFIAAKYLSQPQDEYYARLLKTAIFFTTIMFIGFLSVIFGFRLFNETGLYFAISAVATISLMCSLIAIHMAKRWLTSGKFISNILKLHVANRGMILMAAMLFALSFFGDRTTVAVNKLIIKFSYVLPPLFTVHPVNYVSRHINPFENHLFAYGYAMEFTQRPSLFFHSFGLLFFIMAAISLILIYVGVKNKEGRLLGHFYLLFVLMLILGFFIVNFTTNKDIGLGIMTYAWIKMRFIEPWFYSMFILFFILAGRYVNKNQLRIVLILAWIWILGPFIGNTIPNETWLLPQWWKNFQYFMKII